VNSAKLIAFNFIIPVAIALFFVIFNINQESLPKYLLSLSPYVFYLLSIIVIAISWHFNRIKFIFALLPLLMLYVSFMFLAKEDATSLFKLFSIVYPIHLIVFLLFKERGFFTLWGYLKILLFVFELGLVVWFIAFPNESLINIFQIKIFAFNVFPLSDISVVLGIFILFIMLSITLFGHLLIYNTSFVVMLVSFYVGFYFVKIPHALEHSFIVISLIILVLLIREAYRLAFYDELTSLPGRRALIEDMAKLGRKYSLAMVDIDFFKKFNDTYGHDTGDEVLQMVASKLAEVGGGKSYRYGGEEFVILFPSRERDEAFIHTDILREVIATTPFMVRGKNKNKKIFVNISAGIVQNLSSDNDPFETMKRADKALYKAKEAGRNKVIKA